MNSDVVLPGLIADGGHRALPDVTIRPGAVPLSLDGATASGPTWQIGDRCLLLRIPDIARFLLSDGNEIQFEPEPGADEADIPVFILGTVLGILLHQRGQIVLHASAVRVDGKAILFCGPSGAGKSTMAAALTQRGLPLVTDDICAITVTGGAPMVQPDGRQLKLWTQTIDELALGGSRGPRVRGHLEKFYVEPGAAFSEPLPLGAVYALREARPPHRPGIERPNVVDAALVLQRCAYRPLLVDRMGQKSGYFHAATAIANAAGIFHLTRALDFDAMPDVVGWLERHWRETGLMEKAA
ncbi:MAG: serine kinase of the HPr protein regulates carbohydrate metabolism [Hyphomicrobiales bacterium]|nr:serine kinase of the HPr protein regulates carbohydrate metabolism [Hyphomicrobiales bacterium]